MLWILASVLLWMAAEGPQQNQVPPRPVPKIEVSVTHDKFAKTITRRWQMDLQQTSENNQITLTLEATTTGPEKVSDQSTPTNVFFLVFGFPPNTSTVESTPEKVLLQINCDDKSLSEVVEGKLPPRKENKASTYYPEYGRKDGLVSAPRCSKTGTYWIRSVPMWINAVGEPMSCEGEYSEGILKGTAGSEVGFGCATEIVAAMGMPKKIECRISLMEKRGGPAAKEIVAFSIGQKQWRDLERFSSRISSGK